MSRKDSLFQNSILREGIIVAPIALFADHLESGLILCLGFLLMCFVPLVLTAFVPIKVPILIRSILYTLLAAIFYIPTALITESLFSSRPGGMALVLLSVVGLLNSAHDRLLPKNQYNRSLFKHTLHLVVFIMFHACIRELLGYGSLCSHAVMQNALFPILTYPAGGLVFMICTMVALEAIVCHFEEVPNRANSR